MKMSKRIMAMMLAAVMTFTSSGMSVFAEGAQNAPVVEVSTEEVAEETSVEESSEETTSEEVIEETTTEEETTTVEETTEEVTTEEKTTTVEETTEEATTEEATTTVEETTEEATTEEETTTEEATTEETTPEGLSEDAMLAIQKELKEMLAQKAEEDGYVANGHKDVDYEVGIPENVESNDDSIDAVRAAVTIPLSYDARDYDQDTSVKNQASWGSCWSFQTAAIAESAYKQLKGSEANLSEAHLVEFFYNDSSYKYSGLAGDYTTPKKMSSELNYDYATKEQRGGNGVYTTWGLARWTGIANESTHASMKYDSYDTTNKNVSINIADSYAFTDAMHLENAYWISTQDKESVKRAIMEYGAAGMSYYYSAYYDSEYSEEYYGYDGDAVYYNPYYTSTNHAVTVVGWDDTFSRYNFQNTYDNTWYIENGYSDYAEIPRKDGAWLIKNSWGSSYGDDGYFWISYEDASLKNGIVFAYDFNTSDNFDNNYQYDGSSGTMYMATKGAAAIYNVDMGSQYQTLDAVGVGFASVGNSYTVKIYKNLTNLSNPASGTLMTTQSGKSSFEGFYTIELDEPVALEKGDTFAVVVELKNNGKIFADVSYDGDWINFTTTENLGDTFYKSGSKWADAAAIDGTMRVKAYTNDAANIVDTKVLHEDMVAAIPVQTYTEGNVQPEVKVICNGTTLTKGTDFTVTYNNNVETGTATAIITGKGSYSGTVEKEFTIAKKAITVDMITAPNAAFTGVEYASLVVKNGSAVMDSDDYTVKYNKVPLNAGKYTAIVTGSNNYSGSAKVTFTIDKTNIADATVALETNSVEYDGTAKKPAVTVKLGSQEIAAANYSVKYSANKNAGKVTVTITGKGSLSGKVTKEFTITAKPLTAEMITVPGATYSGKALQPKVTVKDGNKKLTLNKDYTVTYSDNINASEAAKVTVTGKNNYDGTIAKTFVIAPQTVKANTIKAELTLNGTEKNVMATSGKMAFGTGDFDYEIKTPGTEETVSNVEIGKKYDVAITLKGNYTGSKVVKNVECKSDMNSVTVEFSEPDKTYTYNGKAQKPAVVIKNGEDTVAKANYSVSYVDNVNAGTAKVVVTGKKAFAGKTTLEFEIQPKDLTGNLKIKAISAKTYNGKAQTPSVSITGLKAKKDYTVSYANNINASKNATATIKLTNNYKYDGTVGASVTTNFTINPAKINSVKAAAALYKGEGVEVKTTLTVKAGKLVLNAADYDVEYKNHTKVGKASVTVTAKENSNYTDSKTANYNIAKENLKTATVVGVTDLTYTGSAVTHASLVVKNQAGNTISADNYTVSYSKNIKAGKASVKITAKDDSIYAGSKTISFKVLPAKLSNILELNGSLNSKAYTGKKITYTNNELKNAFKESTTGNVISSSSYKVTYKNNIQAGTATMILAGKGNYTGTKEINFTITPKSIDSLTINIKGSAAYIDSNTAAIPEIRKIADGKYNLVKGKDYTISCSGAKDKGVARIKVTGTGNYTGTRSFLYTVK